LFNQPVVSSLRRSSAAGRCDLALIPSFGKIRYRCDPIVRRERNSRVPMLSHPEVVLEAIRNLATVVSGSLATA
jgi:hypothetical protein